MSGQRARSNLVNVVGADATDNSTNGVRSTISRTYSSIITNYAAEYGLGGVVNIITRSQIEQDFHGDALYRVAAIAISRRSTPSARPILPTPVQGGVAFGGPIKKDKTYYYFSYEVTRRHETGFSAIAPAGPDLIWFEVGETAESFIEFR